MFCNCIRSSPYLSQKPEDSTNLLQRYSKATPFSSTPHAPTASDPLSPTTEVGFDDLTYGAMKIHEIYCHIRASGANGSDRPSRTPCVYLLHIMLWRAAYFTPRAGLVPIMMAVTNHREREGTYALCEAEGAKWQIYARRRG